jgi:hypothetical protein
MATTTQRALLARGWSTDRADWAISSGYTITKLKQSTDKQLTDLGLSLLEIDSLRDGSRPPIPDEILIRVLHEVKRTCCICRDPAKAIVVHHIVEWSKSHDHSEDNLVVLCLDHHDAAHTRKALSLSLSANQVREHKSAWLGQVRNADGRAVLGLGRVEGARWDYINHQRLFELATKLGIDV